MFYSNKLYSIPDIAKRFKTKEESIQVLINLGLIHSETVFGVVFLRGNIVVTLPKEFENFNNALKEGKFPEKRAENQS